MLEKISTYVDGGSIRPEEGKVLYDFAMYGKGNGVILEIGTYKGRSALYLGLGTKDANREKVYTIDIDNHIEEINKRLTDFGLYNCVIPIVCNSWEAAKIWDRPIRLLFIDGSHRYEDVVKDFVLFEPFVVKEGIIIFHDATLLVQPDGPIRVFNEFVLTKPEKFEVIKEVGSMKVIFKVCD